MWDHFKRWYMCHSVQITWFLIGWCVLAGIRNLAEGHYASSVMCFGVAYLNYKVG